MIERYIIQDVETNKYFWKWDGMGEGWYGKLDEAFLYSTIIEAETDIFCEALSEKFRAKTVTIIKVYKSTKEIWG